MKWYLALLWICLSLWIFYLAFKLHNALLFQLGFWGVFAVVLWQLLEVSDELAQMPKDIWQ